MTALLNRLHTRLGDLWWYSLMIFIACRSGDAIQAFIGLWLVPKYVGVEELGAVLPLQQLSNLFAVPLAIIAIVFAKYVNTYATRGELGKVKSFIHDVLWASALVFLGCIGIAYLLIPHFYVRLHIASGMLTLLILAAGFMGNISNLFGSALQGLKKFKTMTVVNLISAPIRLVTLLVTMPIRALSGYILGQTTPPAASSLVSAYSLHRELKAVARDTTWRRDLPEIGRYFWPVAAYTTLATIFGTIVTTIYRQRLPEIESSAFYMLSRFSEMAGFVCSSIIVILVPLSSEAHETGKECPSLLRHSVIAAIIVACTLAIIFHLFATPIFSSNETWKTYEGYVYLLPWLTILMGHSTINGMVVSYEMACRRFRLAVHLTIYNSLWTAFLVCFTGYEFFTGLLPNSVIALMRSIHLARLDTLTWASAIGALIQTGILLGTCGRTLLPCPGPKVLNTSDK